MKPDTAWRNRIISSGVEAPDQLLANPFNARIHPKPQQDALSGVLNSVGWIAPVIVNQRSGHVIDGHLRVSLALSRGEKTIPVDYVDLDENEEKILLASFDYITGLAVYDREAVDTLLQQVNSDDNDVQALLDQLGASFDGFREASSDEWETAIGGLDDGDRAPFQQMTFTLHDDQIEEVRAALATAHALGPFVDSPNQNSNGNALARVCTLFSQWAEANG